MLLPSTLDAWPQRQPAIIEMQISRDRLPREHLSIKSGNGALLRGTKELGARLQQMRLKCDRKQGYPRRVSLGSASPGEWAIG